MYEKLMEEAVNPENYGKALKAVIANKGAPGIDGMKVDELYGHLLRHWIRSRLVGILPLDREPHSNLPAGGMDTTAYPEMLLAALA
jgi:hypothetical protein